MKDIIVMMANLMAVAARSASRAGGKDFLFLVMCRGKVEALSCNLS